MKNSFSFAVCVLVIPCSYPSRKLCNSNYSSMCHHFLVSHWTLALPSQEFHIPSFHSFSLACRNLGLSCSSLFSYASQVDYRHFSPLLLDPIRYYFPFSFHFPNFNIHTHQPTCSHLHRISGCLGAWYYPSTLCLSFLYASWTLAPRFHFFRLPCFSLLPYLNQIAFFFLIPCYLNTSPTWLSIWNGSTLIVRHFLSSIVPSPKFIQLILTPAVLTQLNFFLAGQVLTSFENPYLLVQVPLRRISNNWLPSHFHEPTRLAEHYFHPPYIRRLHVSNTISPVLPTTQAPHLTTTHTASNSPLASSLTSGLLLLLVLLVVSYPSSGRISWPYFWGIPFSPYLLAPQEL